MADGNVFVGNLRHSLREEVHAMLITQCPTTLRPIPRINIHHRLLKNMYGITTSKYTVKLPCTEQEWNAAKSNMNETQMNFGVHK